MTDRAEAMRAVSRDIFEVLKRHADAIEAVSEDRDDMLRTMIKGQLVAMLTVLANIEPQGTERTVRELMREQYGLVRDAFVQLAERNQEAWDAPPKTAGRG